MESNPFWLPGDKSMAVAGGLSAICGLQMGGQYLTRAPLQRNKRESGVPLRSAPAEPECVGVSQSVGVEPLSRAGPNCTKLLFVKAMIRATVQKSKGKCLTAPAACGPAGPRKAGRSGSLRKEVRRGYGQKIYLQSKLNLSFPLPPDLFNFQGYRQTIHQRASQTDVGK
ncbi:hypothetical protein PAMP_011233 [Pampus punctatissimus]